MTVSHEIAGWKTEKVAELESRRPYGLTVIGWRITNETCGCQILLGMRLDNNELISGMSPCPQHVEACEDAILRARMHPPCDEPIAEMLARFHGDRVLS